MRQAFQLSEEMGLPIIVRVTRALVVAQEVELAEEEIQTAPPPAFQREFMRWVVLPINVVPYHLRLRQRLEAVQARLEDSSLN